MQIDALADNGHSRVENQVGTPPLDLPVRVASFSDGIYIMRATDNDADLLGGRVVAIDGQPIENVTSKLQELRGGRSAWRRLNASEYLVQLDLLYGIDVAPDITHSNWTVETPAGVKITRRLNPNEPPAAESAIVAKRWLSSEPLSGMASRWSAFGPDRSLPLAWTHFDVAFRGLRLPGTCIHSPPSSNTPDWGRS